MFENICVQFPRDCKCLESHHWPSLAVSCPKTNSATLRIAFSNRLRWQGMWADMPGMVFQLHAPNRPLWVGVARCVTAQNPTYVTVVLKIRRIGASNKYGRVGLVKAVIFPYVSAMVLMGLLPLPLQGKSTICCSVLCVRNLYNLTVQVDRPCQQT